MSASACASASPTTPAAAAPSPSRGSEFVIEADTIPIAIGYGADPVVPDTTSGLQHQLGRPHCDRRRRPDLRKGVFAGGDNVNGADLVVTALADGRRAAEAIAAYLDTLD